MNNFKVLLLVIGLFSAIHLYAEESYKWSNTIILKEPIGTVLSEVTSESESSPVSLSANHNPFNPVTTLQISPVSTGNGASLVVYNVNGTVAADLSKQLLGGKTRIEWNPVRKTSAVYFVKFKTNGQERKIKLALLK